SHCAFICPVIPSEVEESSCIGLEDSAIGSFDSASAQEYLVCAWSNLQLLWESREYSATCLRDNYHVFLTRAAHTGIVQTRFDCEHVPVLEYNFLQPRLFVDFKTEPLASCMEKSDAPALAHCGRETATAKEFLNGFVNRHAINAGLDSL